MDDLVSKAFSNCLQRSESRVSGAGRHKIDGLVDSSEGRDINGLSSDGTAGANSGGVFTSTAFSNSVDEDLDWVLAGNDVYDLENLFNNQDSLLFLTVGLSRVTLRPVAEHERVYESLDNGASHFLESFLLVSSGGVG